MIFVQSSKKLAVMIFAQLILTFVLIWQMGKLPDGNFHFYIFNVPVGDGLLIETPEGHTIAIDGGIDNAIISKIYNQQSFFSKEIDTLVLTHPDSDHVNGAYAILENFDVNSVFITGVESDNIMYEEFLKLAKSKNTPIVFADHGKSFRMGNADFQILYPNKALTGQTAKDMNNTSIVIRANMFGKTIMLTGDMANETEKKLLLSDKPLSSDILKVGHHGSKSSTSNKFLEAVNPKLALISAGEKNTFGHPHQETLDKLAKQNVETLTTKNVGDIEITISPDNSYQIKTF